MQMALIAVDLKVSTSGRQHSSMHGKSRASAVATCNWYSYLIWSDPNIIIPHIEHPAQIEKEEKRRQETKTSW